ncbi:50S ribosomal protein L1 [Candidatus Uhrbacteria bacterium RIFCSPLOWO2_12_FULL_46_10]|uniref:Large ribosomal subunit protein uL1 n=1 Tax=Candidatus Uhrbacteria bacterium RIFCSPLOWO2_01_FULL_47_25 TaxID=1802402 RepID=A0A1F7URG7_9BACT|nr:MAG: 50S ribosomal protein L1 [Candidatus Uhrbacteria bacterium RIFCSPHIGHO2_01_FULL_46_23]OGL69434.1 MAG: 50S ribosomal protein L1 [Candidatus Uhrbacteria bacterium RIFCSPHIGHO2_02_FULL_47_29]OGL75346.1 MAG: 50S ribosomal protein L1 [Candidatus Uhrbacteria bacterium RIFCSPHIGHO2_12_FULL_46_13]OGL80890.1 MAG: 50S ribosomal protein L1 [Candidatus Uhrbacteria bacterium RIFCSPLOWO2_01_FULL_47_25]OGL84724.1 MAG: 50S ribosomal protein L1 [Candidatus Uhrbacteria bacterium RIFCSPLOWO2_02_FULL_46_19
MIKAGKRHMTNKTKIAKKNYSPEEAIVLLKQLKKAKFDESVELHVRLGIDPKQGEQQVRGTVSLPHGVGKSKRIAVFAEGEKELEAKEAGADIIGGKELIDKIRQTGAANFDIAIATPEMMKDLAGIAKILGPKGLMPSPKNETVTPNIGRAVTEIKKGKIAFKNDDTGNIHQIIGKLSFSDQQIIENLNSFMEALRRAKPAASKGVYIRSSTLTTAMGPGVPITLA